MGFDYSYEYSDFAPAIGSAAGAVLGFLLVFYLLAMAAGVVFYILQSVGMYTIAKRRGIRHAWLSWLPIGNVWILGSISDQYQYVAKGKVKNRRKILVALAAVTFLLTIFVIVTVVGTILAVAASLEAGEALSGAAVAISLLGNLAIIAVCAVSVVFQFMSLYDLYASCNPDNAVMFLVLSIFIGVTIPFFVFACRKKDGGMPPRKIAAEVYEEQPTEQTEE